MSPTSQELIYQYILWSGPGWRVGASVFGEPSTKENESTAAKYKCFTSGGSITLIRRILFFSCSCVELGCVCFCCGTWKSNSNREQRISSQSLSSVEHVRSPTKKSNYDAVVNMVPERPWRDGIAGSVLSLPPCPLSAAPSPPLHIFAGPWTRSGFAGDSHVREGTATVRMSTKRPARLFTSF